MERLTARDVRAVMHCLHEIHQGTDPDRFAERASRALFDLVGADRCTFNLWRPDALLTVVHPGGARLEGQLLDALARYGHQSPILSHYRRTDRLDVCTFSDFATRASFQRLPLYNEYYRRVGIEHQILAPLRFTRSPRTEVGFALSRARPDFKPRDRRVLQVLQPHLIQAHANAEAMASLTARTAWMEELVDRADQAAILLDATDSIRYAGGRGRQLLRKYFGGPDRDRLPGLLAGWVREEGGVAGDADGLLAPRRPLTIVRDAESLRVRLLVDGPRRVLLLQERAAAIDPAALLHLGLTRRQAEVLAWVTEGKTNDEIGTIVGARPATVAKHLERIYRQLGVESRTAAAVEALAAAGVSGDLARGGRASREPVTPGGR